MAADEFAFEGYPVSDVKNRYGLKPYVLEAYEKSSIDEIRRLLRKRDYTDPAVIEQHLVYLESLSKKLTLILSGEEREGMLNLELKESVAEVKGMCMELIRRFDSAKQEMQS